MVYAEEYFEFSEWATKPVLVIKRPLLLKIVYKH